jgi:hypothetical protein
MNYDEQITGLVEELLKHVEDHSISIDEVQKKLELLNKRIDEQQEFEKEVMAKFLAELQELINPLNYHEDPGVRDVADKIIRMIYKQRVKYAEIRFLEEGIA